ncbi:hypothetical protein Tco_1364066 [Tanacetum coccineum]
MQKLETEFWCHDMVGAGHAAYTDRFHELARLVPHLITPKNKRIERMLTDEAIRNEALKKNTEKRGNDREPSMDGNVGWGLNAQTATITVNPKCLVIGVQTTTASDTLPRIVGWGLG